MITLELNKREGYAILQMIAWTLEGLKDEPEEALSEEEEVFRDALVSLKGKLEKAVFDAKMRKDVFKRMKDELEGNVPIPKGGNENETKG